MESQLTLIEPEGPSWRLDEPTRQAGRLGIAMAREALRGAAVASTGRGPGRDEPGRDDVHDRSAA